MKTIKALSAALAVATALTSVSCVGDGGDTIVLAGEEVNLLGIPSDKDATPNPEIGKPNTTMPNPVTTVQTQDGVAYVSVSMTGVWDAVNNEWLKLYGTNSGKQNVWVSVDGKPKGIDIYNVSEGNGSKSVMLDIVFLVDNSGSMSEEANLIAAEIENWVNNLRSSGVDLRVGCVGYSEYGYVNGGIDLTDVQPLTAFLNRSTGTNRTVGFAGSNANMLQQRAASDTYRGPRDECGVVALRFANDLYSFRGGANRVYVNFTDEPNQPNNCSQFSVEYVNPANNNWPASAGTIHTVYSDTNTSFTESANYREYPWHLSEYTGGTFISTNSSFSGVSLSTLPVTGAISNSYVIRFTNIEEFMDGQPHIMKITILTPNGSVAAEKEIAVIFV